MDTRFDLGAKKAYIDYFIKNIQSDWAKYVYDQHMTTFNGCWEHPGTKSGIKQFYNEFNSLIKNMRKIGFDNSHPIQINNQNILINGAHRLTTSICLGILPKIITQNIPSSKYDYSFFLNRSGFPVLKSNIADFMALEYLQLLHKASNMNFKYSPPENNIRSIILWPSISNHPNLNKIEPILNKYGTVLYDKKTTITKKGCGNFIKEVYRGEEWIGGLFPPDGRGGKLPVCWNDTGIIKVLLFYFNDPSKDIQMKAELRSLFNLGKHSLHISDHFTDTWRIATSILNENSLYYINKGTNPSINTQKRLKLYFEQATDDYAVTSSTILDMFGLRAAGDLDFLVLNSDVEGCHKGVWLSYYNKHHHEIIYNPSNYFYFNGFKFATLNVIKQMKLIRNEEKDKEDIKFINTFF